MILPNESSQKQKKYYLFAFNRLPCREPINLINDGLFKNTTISKPEKTGLFFMPGKKSTARSLLKFAGSWVGDDLQTCLNQVQITRRKAKF